VQGGEGYRQARMGFYAFGEMIGLLQVLGSNSTSADKEWRTQGRGSLNLWKDRGVYKISWNPLCINYVFDAVELQDINSGTGTSSFESESTKRTYTILYKHQQSQELSGWSEEAHFKLEKR